MHVKSASWRPELSPTFWINHASRLIMRHFERSLRPMGFGMAYLPVVMSLEEHGPLLQKDLAERAHVEQPTMAALVTRMERDGLLSRKPHPDDKRATLLSLTPKGKARLPGARDVLLEGAERALRGLSKRDRETLIALLQRVAANLSQDT